MAPIVLQSNFVTTEMHWQQMKNQKINIIITIMMSLMSLTMLGVTALFGQTRMAWINYLYSDKQTFGGNATEPEITICDSDEIQ